MMPQLIYLALVCLGLGATAASHGQQTKNNFYAALLAASIKFYLLYLGGFYAPLGWKP